MSATAPRPQTEVGRGPGLFLVARGNAPLAPTLRILLGELDEVGLLRGRDVELEQRADRPRIAGLAIDDPRLSSRHARLARLHGSWFVEDLGSKNGTFVNGERVTRAALADGDVIDAGQTLLMYRDGVPQDGPATYRPGPAPPGLASLIPALQRAFAELRVMAASPVAILIGGETGTGKELAARAVHQLSARAGELVALNCAALPRELVEAELFGTRRGSFSGATDRAGLVAASDGGTLFLDEVGDLPLPAQATLLRTLQEHEVRPLGVTRAVPIDLRVVAATHRPLESMVSSGGFRADLLARLSGHRIVLPPLRERVEDLGLVLADILRAQYGADAGGVTIRIGALRALSQHAWPANGRELHQAIASARAKSGDHATIDVEHLALRESAPPDDMDRARLEAIMREHRGNIAAVARSMGKARMQIQRWLKRHGLDPAAFRG
jgi:transcriptional regulator of acetoin/glycerol metabolism